MTRQNNGDLFTIIGEVIGHRGRHRIIVKEDETGTLYELDRHSAITPVEPVRSLIEYLVTRNDYKIIDGERKRIWG